MAITAHVVHHQTSMLVDDGSIGGKFMMLLYQRNLEPTMMANRKRRRVKTSNKQRNDVEATTTANVTRDDCVNDICFLAA